MLAQKMAPNTLAMVKAAAESNDISQLRTALGVWLAEEHPEPPRDPKLPMASFQDQLHEALMLANLEVAEELLDRGCVIDKSLPIMVLSLGQLVLIESRCPVMRVGTL